MLDFAIVCHYNWHSKTNRQAERGDKMLKIKEVAERLNVTERTVRNYIADGYLKAIRLNGGKKQTLRVTEEALQEFLEKGD